MNGYYFFVGFGWDHSSELYIQKLCMSVCVRERGSLPM